MELEFGTQYSRRKSVSSSTPEYFWVRPIIPMTGNSWKPDEKITGEVRHWVVTTFRRRKWFRVFDKYCFTNQADQMLFLLRWQ